MACFGLPVSSAQTGGGFGTAVSSADVNGDGFSDLIVGEPNFDGNFTNEGRVLVYHGSASGPATTPSWQRKGGQTGAHAGAALAGVGDLNGDGFDDVVIGAPDFDAPRALQTSGPGMAAPIPRRLRDAGAIAIFLGSPSGLGLVPVVVRFGPEEDEHLGIALSRAGDVNGDGYDDLVAGALGTGAALGCALVFHGSASGPEQNPSWIVLGSESHARFGFSVGGGGDINGDGFDDVLVGAPDAGPDDLGSAWAYLGSASGLATTPSWSLPWDSGSFDGNQNYTSEWGYSVAIAGDMNGDGFDDVLVGNPNYHGAHIFGVPLYWAGAVWLFGGAPSGPVSVSLTHGTSSFRWGATCVGVGDLDGDGLADMAYSSLGFGFVQVVLGQGDYAGTTSLVFGNNGTFGRGLSSAGDVDGDGRDEFLVGEPSSVGGSAYILRGPGISPFWTLESP